MAHKDNLPRIIIDTNAWITFFCYEANPQDLHKEALKSEREEIASRVAALIDGNGKDHTIAMPTVIYAELMGMIRGKGRTPKARKYLVDKAVEFLQTVDFMFIELDEQIVLEAQKHIKDYDLTGIDASILASAEYYEYRRVFTSDKKMLNIGSSIPGVNVEEPPESYTLHYKCSDTGEY